MVGSGSLVSYGDTDASWVDPYCEYMVVAGSVCDDSRV